MLFIARLLKCVGQGWLLTGISIRSTLTIKGG